MRRFPLYQVDSFTSIRFRGNPAAVCLCEQELDAPTMQAIAQEMNLSETAFVWPQEDRTRKDETLYGLRWFTPTAEVRLCGHGTLASAHVLLRERGLNAESITFDTKSGPLIAKKEGNKISMELPMYVPEMISPPRELMNAMRVQRIVDAALSREAGNIILRLHDEEDLRSIHPNFEELRDMSLEGAGGVILTQRGWAPYDFLLRYFSPWYGINEDPVTGSAHCVLAPFWARILERSSFKAYQASERGGELDVSCGKKKVHIAGESTTVFSGELRV